MSEADGKARVGNQVRQTVSTAEEALLSVLREARLRALLCRFESEEPVCISRVMLLLVMLMFIRHRMGQAWGDEWTYGADPSS